MADLYSSPASRAPYGNDLNCTFDYKIKYSKLELIDLPSPDSSNNSSYESSGIMSLGGDADNAKSLDVHELIDNQWTVEEESSIELIRDLRHLLIEMGANKLKSMRNEVLNCDPYRGGVVDTKTFQRVINRYFRETPLTCKSWTTLVNIFSREPKRPVEIVYEPLFHFLKRILMAETIQFLPKPLAEELNDHDNLRKEIKSCLDNAGVVRVDTSRLYSSYLICDKDKLGLLSEQQLTAIIIALEPELWKAIQPVFPSILNKCLAQEEQKYNWALFCDLLKVSPVLEPIKENRTYKAEIMPESPLKQGKLGRRDMQSSFNGLPGSLFATLPNSKPLPPIATQENMSKIDTPSPVKARIVDRSVSKPLPQIQTSNNEQIVSSMKSDKDVSPEVKHLIDALNRLDPLKSGRVRVTRARQLIQQYKDLHGIHINPRKLDQLFYTSQDTMEAYINLNTFAEGLKNI